MTDDENLERETEQKKERERERETMGRSRKMIGDTTSHFPFF